MKIFIIILFFIALLLSCKTVSAAKIQNDMVFLIAQKAYIYGYPLILMDLTKKTMTNNNLELGHAPINQFAHANMTPIYQFTDVVRPNVDTLYSSAWLDLSKGPITLTVPDSKERFYIIALYDMFTNIFKIIDKDVTKNKQKKFAIVGPSWQGSLPKGIEKIHSPSNFVWIILRIQINGQTDLTNACKIQQQFKLTPLDDHVEAMSNKKSNKKINNKKPMDQVAAMSGEKFFTLLMRLLSEISPPETDGSILDEMKLIGLVPRKDFDFSKIDKKIQSIFNKIPEATLKFLLEKSELMNSMENHWAIITKNTGSYGIDYLQRAIVAMIGLGMLPSTYAFYPNTISDSTGQRLSGQNIYNVHFEKDQIPPVNAFWSLTMYNKNGFLVKNLINRYALGDRDDLKFNPDGSLDILIQNKLPDSEKISNWLPAPKDNFALTLRLYLPKKSVIDGKWKLPSVLRLDRKINL